LGLIAAEVAWTLGRGYSDVGMMSRRVWFAASVIPDFTTRYGQYGLAMKVCMHVPATLIVLPRPNVSHD
jgi:hypothetical protein